MQHRWLNRQDIGIGIRGVFNIIVLGFSFLIIMFLFFHPVKISTLGLRYKNIPLYFSPKKGTNTDCTFLLFLSQKVK
jgi:hypothetical protein